MGKMSESETAFSVMPAKIQHLESLVDCHIRSFPESFMTALGKRFIRCFYQFCIEADHILLVAVDGDGCVIGCVCGGPSDLTQAFNRKYLLRHIHTVLGRAVINRRVRRGLWPHIKAFGRRIMRIGRRRADKQPDSNTQPSAPCASLLSICTDPRARGMGVAGRLIESFEQQSIHRHYGSIRLSAHSDNTAAVHLYKKRGYDIVRETHGGVYFQKHLN